jgi:protein-tyrosine phosphatase
VTVTRSDPPQDPARERLVALEGCRNFRDLGGYRTADGRAVRWGRLYRADALGALTPADLEVVAALGVRTICDLRGEQEAARDPDAPIAGADRVGAPMGEGDSDHGFIERLRSGEMAEVTDADMARIYGLMLDRFGEQIRLVFDRAADPDRHALVFHCAAGKDRTGIIAALLLGALGVPVDDILDDYELTNRYRTSYRIAELRPLLADQGLDIDKMLPYFSAPRVAMADALAGLDTQHGSIEAYLTGPVGVPSATLATLRDHLLED